MCLSRPLGEANISACSVTEIVPCNNARLSLPKLVRRYFLPTSFDSSRSIIKSGRQDTRTVVSLYNADIEVHVLCRILAVVFSDVPHYLQIVAKTAL
jgi:hypothetical protein